VQVTGAILGKRAGVENPDKRRYRPVGGARSWVKIGAVAR
jgi:hypothetical protein